MNLIASGGVRARVTKSRMGAFDHEEAVTVRRIRYQRSCVETVLGQGMPNAYAQDIVARVEGRDADGLRRLVASTDALQDAAGQTRANAEISTVETSLYDDAAAHSSFAEEGLNGVGNDALAFPVALHGRAEFLDDADGLVSDRQPFRDRILAPEDMNVGAADGGGRDPQQGVQRADIGRRLVLKGDPAGLDEHRSLQLADLWPDMLRQGSDRGGRRRDEVQGRPLVRSP